MADLSGSTIASTYQAILALPLTGGNTTNLVALTDGDGVNTFCLQLATTKAMIAGSGNKLYFHDEGDEHISAAGGDLTIAAGTALNITADIIDLSDATKDITLNAAVDALNFDSNTLSIDASNNRVGIGTSTPDAQLDIEVASGSYPILRLGRGDSDTDRTMGELYFGNGEDGFLCSIAGYEDSATDAGGLKFLTEPTGGDNTVRMTITSAGLVGIGTDGNPGALLHIDRLDNTAIHATNGPQSGAKMIIRNASDRTGEGHASLIFQTNNAQTSISSLLTSSEQARMIFHTETSADTHSEAMTILYNGNVGIGTPAPANPLAVNRSGDGVIVDFESADSVEGTVSISSATTSYNAFVGSHYTQLKDGQSDLPIGSVVISTGEIITCNLVTEAIKTIEAVEAKDAVLDDDGNVIEEEVVAKEAVAGVPATTTNVPNKEYFTYINTTTMASDPAVYGVWMGKMSDDAKGHSFGDDDKPIYLVAQVGLYKIRVTDTNGNISNGDYLESSTRAMEGHKQTSTAKVNSTIGKAMIDVDWSSVETDSDLGYKWKLIPCIF